MYMHGFILLLRILFESVLGIFTVNPFCDSVDIFEDSFRKINEIQAIIIEDGMY